MSHPINLNLNLKHLHYFWTTAHSGSIAKASQQLHITPQTISGQIAMLERQIGSKLFEKSGRGLILSDKGRLVLQYADDIFRLSKELGGVLQGELAKDPPQFVVSAASALPKTVVYRIIEPALNLPQEYSLTSKEGPVADILGELAVHKVDMVIADTPLPESYNIKAFSHYLGKSHLKVFASNAIAHRYMTDFPSCLHQAPVLLPTPQYAIRRDIDQWFSEQGITPQVRGQFDDSALTKSFGQSGLGLFFVPAVIADEVGENFDAQSVGEIESVVQRYYAITTNRKIEHPAVAAICDHARQSLF